MRTCECGHERFIDETAGDNDKVSIICLSCGDRQFLEVNEETRLDTVGMRRINIFEPCKKTYRVTLSYDDDGAALHVHSSRIHSMDAIAAMTLIKAKMEQELREILDMGA
jgi:hypothetical protein